jgi:hypothetical protein
VKKLGTVGDRAKMGDFVTVGILGGKAKAGGSGDVAKFHGDRGVTSEAIEQG